MGKSKKRASSGRGRAKLTRERIATLYARSIARAVKKYDDLDGIGHTMFAVINGAVTGSPKVSFHMPENWAEDEVREIMTQHLEDWDNWGQVDHKCALTVQGFVQGFINRLRKDLSDDPKVSDTVIVGVHPEGATHIGFVVTSGRTKDDMYRMVKRAFGLKTDFSEHQPKMAVGG